MHSIFYTIHRELYIFITRTIIYKVKQYLDPAYEASWLPEVANLPLPVSRADNGVGRSFLSSGRTFESI